MEALVTQGKVTQEYAGLMKLRLRGNQGLLLCAKRMHNSVQKHVKKFLIQLTFFSVKIISYAVQI